MIIINEAPDLYLPRTVDKAGTLTITFIGTTSRKATTIEREDKSTSKLYYKVDSLSLPVGEYEYTATIDDVVVDKGLATVTKQQEIKIYKTSNDEYIVYGS